MERSRDVVTRAASRLWMLLGVAATVLCALSFPAAAGDKLVLTYVQGNAAYWDLDVALEKGFFAEAGFSPEFVALQSSPGGIQQAIGQSVNIVGGSPEPLIDAYEHGATDLGFIAAPVKEVDWTLNVRPEIKTIDDLKGKTIGVSAIKGGEVWLTRQLIAAMGLKTGDVNVIQVGVSPLKLAALERGSIAAAVLFQPSGFLADKDGYHALSSFSKVPTWPYPIYMAGRTWSHEADRGQRFTRAIQKADAWLYDPSHRDEAIVILKKYTKRNEPAVLDRTYEAFLGGPDKLLNTDGRVDLDGLARLLAVVKEEGDLKGAPDPKKYMIPAADGGLTY